jgi:Zn-dependent protease
MAIVAVAGPLANLAMAILYALPLRLGLVSGVEIGTFLPTPWELLTIGLQINLLLFVFNLMPIPPLDGFTILQGLLPPDMAYQLDGLRQYGTMILLGVLIVLPLIGFDVFGAVILPIMSQLAALLVGIG